MKMLSNKIVAFAPRRPYMAAVPAVVARGRIANSANLICRWTSNPVTGRIVCVWTSALDAGREDEAPADLRLAS